MAKKYEGNLIECKGSIRLRGIIQGKDTPKKGMGYTDAPAKDGKKAYRSLRFLLATSADNKPVVELFGTEKDFAYAYSKKEGKSLKVEWAKRFNKLPDGYELILPEYDLAKKLNEELKDGMSVVVIGNAGFGTYADKQGVKQEQTTLNIRSTYPSTEAIDFENSEFEEEATFEQEIVVRDVVEDKKENKTYVYAYVIKYGGKFEPATFTINGEVSARPFIDTMRKFKFGDFLKVAGVIKNQITKQTITDEFGTREVGGAPIKTLEIRGAFPDTIEKKKYKEDDFIVSQAAEVFAGRIDSEASPQGNSVPVVPFKLD